MLDAVWDTSVVEATQHGELALEVLVKVDEQRLERAKKEPHRGVLLNVGKGLPLLVVAPFPTEKALERWAKKNNINPGDVTHVVVKRPEEV